MLGGNIILPQYYHLAWVVKATSMCYKFVQMGKDKCIQHIKQCQATGLPGGPEWWPPLLSHRPKMILEKSAAFLPGQGKGSEPGKVRPGLRKTALLKPWNCAGMCFGWHELGKLGGG